MLAIESLLNNFQVKRIVNVFTLLNRKFRTDTSNRHSKISKYRIPTKFT